MLRITYSKEQRSNFNIVKPNELQSYLLRLEVQIKIKLSWEEIDC